MNRVFITRDRGRGCVMARTPLGAVGYVYARVGASFCEWMIQEGKAKVGQNIELYFDGRT